MDRAGPVVIKVGGSLLDLPDLPARLPKALERWSGRRPALLAGGGAAADLVRGWDRALGLGEERSHRLALSAMALNGQLIREVLPGSRAVLDREGLAAAWEAGALPILEPRAFLEREEAGSPAPLPHLWSATSDAVAAWIAVRLEAPELVLLKSAPPPRGATLGDLAAEGYIDPHLPGIVGGIMRVFAMDLRDGEEQLIEIPTRMRTS